MRSVKEAEVRRHFDWGILRADMIGHWNIVFDERGIRYAAPSSDGHLAWNTSGYLVESDDLFFLYTDKGQMKMFFQKALLGEAERVQGFAKYCIEHGLEHKRITPKVDRTAKGRVFSGKRLLIFLGAMILLLIFTGILAAVTQLA